MREELSQEGGPQAAEKKDEKAVGKEKADEDSIHDLLEVYFFSEGSSNKVSLLREKIQVLKRLLIFSIVQRKIREELTAMRRFLQARKNEKSMISLQWKVFEEKRRRGLKGKKLLLEERLRRKLEV